MKIKGIQELTLIDYPNKLACTIFLFGCNFQCGFCHNPNLVIRENSSDIPKSQILDFSRKRKNLLDGVCITGGEPLLNIDEEFLQEIKFLNYSIKIDTNGTFPEKLQELIQKNLVDYLAMDIKSSKEKYFELTNTNVDLNKIEHSIKLISQFPEYEFRTTIIEGIHTIEEMKKIAEWINQIIEHKPRKFVLQGFKIQRDLIDNKFRLIKNTSENYLNELKEILQNYFENIEIRV